ncbi:MAG: polysaccharide biosynthesis protein [Chloroflexi bacterium]|jgi:FlaA1/EpsC-like NDP-sugar epimerase|nr:polysaccharide biosynthesis protein [Chloroflexota bacterium]
MRLRSRYLLLIDLLAVTFAAIAAFVVRYEALVRIGPYIRYNSFFFLIVLLVRPTVYYIFGLYRSWWRYASIAELIAISHAVTVGSIITAALIFGFFGHETNGVRDFSRSVLLLDWLLNMFAIGATRILLRMLQSKASTYEKSNHLKTPQHKVLIMGAGDAGALIAREMQNNAALGLLPIGFLDDDPVKQGAQIYGISVLGTRQDIPRLAREEGIDEVVIAMPTAPGSAIRDVRAICAKANVKTRTIPGLYELLNGSVSVSQIREVKIEDLLRREPIRTNLAAVEGYIHNAVVLVTGAGGSIGSELCRQIAARKPRQLLLLGHGEGSIYNIVIELQRSFPQLSYAPLIADVRDAGRIERLFLKHRPDVVFHAAAHKHVPLMESNPEEAFTTNVLGTRNVLRAAEKAGTSRFVLISSDKAVNPVNIMGASKYLAELLVQQTARRTGRSFVVVRFGNVLGSRGSVVPLFERQIATGGPVTVTHPDMIRYFMTIPEAVQLVMQAAALGEGGEVFVLDMGEQIRILDLARDLISLSGLKPDEDIEIKFVGIRPGEKLYEELFAEGEKPMRTSHGKILRARSHQIITEEKLAQGIDAILAAARQEDPAALSEALQAVLPTYSQPGQALPRPALVKVEAIAPAQPPQVAPSAKSATA